MAWDNTTEEYFTGQGVVLAAERNADGTPRGFFEVGNVPELKIATALNYEEHRESKSGGHGVDRRILKETNVTFASIWENFSSGNLALLLRAKKSKVEAATITDQTLVGYLGRISTLGRIKVSNVVLKQGTTALTEYTNDATPWDYRVNADAGSIKINGTNVDKLGLAITAVAVGAATTLTMSPVGVAVGASIALRGFTGADANLLNDVTATVTDVTGTTVVVAVNTTGKVITSPATAKAFFDGMPLLASFAHTEQVALQALSEPATDLWIRYEGLNTVESNEPVVVDIYKVSTDPLKELALIADTIQQAAVEGSVLVDTTRPEGVSKYYTVTKVR